jgi:peptidoglycan biosynthesis protein MviN/MurJ (putative lipid II flippase)
MAFGGFGPIILGIIYLILSLTLEDFSLGGPEVFVAIVSTYLLAFVQAGASVFNQIEHWPLAKSLAVHLGTLYLAYVGCYLINFWIPFDWVVILIFTLIFMLTYFVVWFSVYFAIKAASKHFNKKLS